MALISSCSNGTTEEMILMRTQPYIYNNEVLNTSHDFLHFMNKKNSFNLRYDQEEEITFSYVKIINLNLPSTTLLGQGMEAQRMSNSTF